MQPTKPFNIFLMEVENTVLRNNLKEITSHSMFEPSSSKFHPEGMYSEEIFGEINSQERKQTFSYIDIKTKIMHPHVFRIIMSLKNTYEGIVSGRTYAVFSEQLKDFIPCTKDTPNAQTGYNFFIENILNVNFQKSSSIKRDKKLQILQKYKEDRIFLVKYLVSPAGIRDVEFTEDGFPTKEESNNLYLGLLQLSQALPDQISDELLILYDTIRYSIQKKANQIFLYFWDLFTGKQGFAQSKHAARAIVFGARNVISAAKMETQTPDDPDFLKHDESLFPVFQAMKMFQPMLKQKIKSIFIEPFFSLESQSTPLIDPNTYNVIYVELTDKELAKWNSSEGLSQIINSYEDNYIREMPVTVQGKDNKNYYLMLVYDDDDEIYYLRDVNEFKERYEKQKESAQFNILKVRPLTYIEMFYYCLIDGIENKHALISRYPVIEAGSIYPSKSKIGTTVPSRIVKFKSQFTDMYVTFSRYPILGNPHLDSTVVHSSKLPGLGGDYDCN